MEAVLSKSLFDSNKDTVKEWIKAILLEHTGEVDEMLLEYIVVMISNGKSAHEIAVDLDALVGDSSTAMADAISGRINSLINSDVVETDTVVSVSEKVPTESISNVDLLLSKPLKVGRSVDSNKGLQRNNGRCNQPKRNVDTTKLDKALDSSRFSSGRGGSGSIVQESARGSNSKRSTIRETDSGFVTNKKSRAGGTEKASHSSGVSQANVIALQSGFASAEEMIVFQQQQLMAMLQQQTAHQGYGYNYSGYPHHNMVGRASFGRHGGRAGGRFAAGRDIDVNANAVVDKIDPTGDNGAETLSIANLPGPVGFVHNGRGRAVGGRFHPGRFSGRGRGNSFGNKTLVLNAPGVTTGSELAGGVDTQKPFELGAGRGGRGVWRGGRGGRGGWTQPPVCNKTWVRNEQPDCNSVPA